MSKTSKSKKKVSANDNSRIIETDSEVKSYIYQQVADFNPYVTPDTLITVIARDPKEIYTNSTDESENYFDEGHNFDGLTHEELSKYKHRIAIVLQEDGATLEAEAYHDDIYEAIKLAKNSLIERLSELHDEVQKSEEGSELIKSISSNEQLH